MVKVDLEMTEFFYSQRPKELEEYRRLKTLEQVRLDNGEAERLADEISQKSQFRDKGPARKRKKKRGTILGRLKGSKSRIKGRGNHKKGH